MKTLFNYQKAALVILVAIVSLTIGFINKPMKPDLGEALLVSNNLSASH
jgi:hypothetical protein